MTTKPRLILDIGTHKVLGLAVLPAADGIEVLAHSLRTHGSRAMRDGQVHDVPAVARTVRTVVSEIERDLRLLEQAATSEHGFSPWGEEEPSLSAWSAESFSEAYIAAAGRALQTARGRAEQTEPRPVLITGAMQQALEWDAVADAQANLLATLPASEHGKGFYCIAHTRTDSFIDGEPIASLIDQRGSRFSVEVLATFLPGIVVDSLQAVLRNANLTMRGLTLEPVAALEAVVPDSMRHLRLMLVDVGAGTTDIAFTGGGTVQAYAMVPVGGDAITSALAHQFLLDFNVAEQAKRTASRGETATVQNALGDGIQIGPDALWDAIETPATNLARAVARAAESWDLDDGPDAVLLVGGGSNTPRLPALLAAELHMPTNRIAVRDRTAVRNAAGQQSLQGPDVVTALGIGLRFAEDRDPPPVRVRVNGRPVSLFQPDRCTVREAARIAGLPLNRLVGRLGHGMTVTVNGELLVIPGRRGQSATVLVNGEAASLDTLLQMNDDVELETPDGGDSARLTVAQLAERWQRQRREQLGLQPPAVVWNDVRRPLPLLARRRGQPAAFSDTVLDRDDFEFRWPRTVGELLEIGAAAGAGSRADALADTRADTGAPLAPTEFPADTGADSSPAARAHAGARADAGARATSQSNFSSATDPASSTPAASPESTTSATDPASTTDSGIEPRSATVAGWAVEAKAAAPFAIEQSQTFPIVLNGEPTSVKLAPDLRLNGQPAGPSDRMKDGDRIHIKSRSAVALYELLAHPEIDAIRRGGILEGAFDEVAAADVTDADDAAETVVSDAESPPVNDADSGDADSVSLNDEAISESPTDSSSGAADSDWTHGPASKAERSGPRKLNLFVRGEPAGFTTLVHPGDAVDIRYA